MKEKIIVRERGWNNEYVLLDDTDLIASIEASIAEKKKTEKKDSCVKNPKSNGL